MGARWGQHRALKPDPSAQGWHGALEPNASMPLEPTSWEVYGLIWPVDPPINIHLGHQPKALSTTGLNPNITRLTIYPQPHSLRAGLIFWRRAGAGEGELLQIVLCASTRLLSSHFCKSLRCFHRPASRILPVHSYEGVELH